MTKLLLTLTNKMVAYKAYMPFIKDGAIFVPTTVVFKLGDEVEVVINLKELNKSINVMGPVVWITPPASRTREGVGIRFVGESGVEAKKMLATYLAGLPAKAKQETYTL